MQTEIIMFYVICDNLPKAMNIRDDIQRINTAEVMTVVLTAARFFCGNIRNAADFLREHGYAPDMLGESRLNRWMHATDESVWENLFLLIFAEISEAAGNREYLIDSFPVPVCDNIRIPRSKIFRGEDYRGFIVSKHRYFYGIRIHMITTASGKPVGFVIAPGRDSDLSVFRQMRTDPPGNPICYGDKIYNDYNQEDMLREAAGIIFSPIRKKNSVRATGSRIERIARQNTRRRIETSFSQITNFFPKKIRAVTPKGFLLKVISFIISFSFYCLNE